MTTKALALRPADGKPYTGTRVTLEVLLKRAIVLVLVALALNCKDTTKPPDPWIGTWHLISVNSVPTPAKVTIYGYPSLVVLRTLEVWAGGEGRWTDSTLSAYSCGISRPPSGMCDYSGASLFTWTVAGDTLTFVRTIGTAIGYLTSPKRFVKQSSGDVFLADDNQTEVYRRWL